MPSPRDLSSAITAPHDWLSCLSRDGYRRWRRSWPYPGAIPAPPLIALIGLLGMVLGEQAIEMAKRHVSSFPQASVEQSNDAHGPLGPGAPPRTTATTDCVNTTKYCINLEVMSILKRRV
jgi:xanthosine utilization system XapX-like protein